MTDRPLRGKPLAHVLDEVLLQDELDAIAAMDPAALDKELADAGYDAARTRQRIEAARQAAYDAPVGKAPSPASPPAKVVSLEAARAKRSVSTRWGLLAAAAAVALLVGGGGAQYAATWKPATTVTYATVGQPPSPRELAAPARRRGLRLCDEGYYAECQDALDQARGIDPAGEADAAVKAAREAIEADHPTPVYVKPGLGPRERPLQHHP